MKNLDSIIPVSDEGLYPIRTISEVSGVNAITLRAWERRYGLFKPKRTPKGHRLYSEKDIQRIHQVLALLAKGIAISRVANALKQEHSILDFPSFASKNSNKSDTNKLNNKQWTDYQETLLTRINSYDIVQLENIHHDLLSRFSMETVNQKLISPVFTVLRNRAKQLPSLSGDYHFYKAFLSQRIGGLFLKSSIQNKGKKLLLMSVDSNQNDIELLLFAMPLLNHGYQIIVLGCDITFDAIPMVLAASNADGLLLHSGSESSGQLNASTFHTVVSNLKTPVFIIGQQTESQKNELKDSDLIVLPNICEEQISTINEQINSANQ